MADMKIYVLKRDNADSEEAHSFVVVAPDGLAARKLAAGADKSGAYEWAFEATCALLGTADMVADPGIVLGAYTSCL
jgi:hypothetical protein